MLVATGERERTSVGRGTGGGREKTVSGSTGEPRGERTRTAAVPLSDSEKCFQGGKNKQSIAFAHKRARTSDGLRHTI